MNLREIAKAFDKLSKNYDLISYTMSLGVTIYWRKKLINEASQIINQKNENSQYILDLCSGTGDIAIGIHQQSKNKTIKIIALDISFGMLKKLKEKIHSRNIEGIIPILADIYQMPFKNKSFLLSTISFGARSLMENEKDFQGYFKEIYRTSKIMLNLETSHPNNPIIKTLYYAYLYFVIIILGGIFFPHYNKEYFRTIMKFPTSENFSKILQQSGYREIQVINLLFGMAAIHIAYE